MTLSLNNLTAVCCSEIWSIVPPSVLVLDSIPRQWHSTPAFPAQPGC